MNTLARGRSAVTDKGKPLATPRAFTTHDYYELIREIDQVKAILNTKHRHYFLWGRCEHCGVSRVAWDRATKEQRRHKERLRQQEKAK